MPLNWSACEILAGNTALHRVALKGVQTTGCEEAAGQSGDVDWRWCECDVVRAGEVGTEDGYLYFHSECGGMVNEDYGVADLDDDYEADDGVFMSTGEMNRRDDCDGL